MSVLNELQIFLEQNGGTITTARANAIGISNERLRLFVDIGKLERIAHGVYISPNDFPDKMFVAQIRRPKMIYSHETALFLHELTDRDPISSSFYCQSQQKGMNVHSAIAVTMDGLPLGILHQQYNTRETPCDQTRKKDPKKDRPIEEKESYQWLQTME